MGKETAEAKFVLAPRHSPGRTEKSREKTLIQGTCPGQHSNRSSRKYKSLVIPVEPTYSVKHRQSIHSVPN